MATVLAMLGGAVVNALAFSGSNYAFGKLRENKSLEEAERHNKQMEQYTRQQADYNKKRAANIDWLNHRLQEQKSSQQAFSDVNFALQQYHNLISSNENIPHSLQQEMRNTDLPYPELSPPSLPDFKKNEELIFVGVGTATVCAIIYWIY